jgi:N-carbamoyl-L-amino-acid hydrolase
MIGIVTGVQGQKWYEITVIGRESHAGSTPMPLRKDAMLACARMVEAINAIALNHAPLAVSTVGLVEVKPNSRNVIPGQVFFSVDLRHPDDTVLRQMDKELEEMVGKVAADMDITAKLENIWNSPSMKFNKECIGLVRAAAEDLGYRHRDMVSGAGHDAVYIARVAPTAMIFIPCQNGISHNEMEKTEPEHVAAGANVLLNAVLAYDKAVSG